MKKISKKWKLLIGIFGAFVIFNLVWATTISLKYGQYTKQVPKNDLGIYGKTDQDGYSYNVKKPDYLQFTGNLGVTSESGNSLIIWPKLTGGYEYGVILSVDHTMYQITLDSNMQTKDEDEYIKKLVENHQDTILELLDKAKNMWEL